MIKELAVNQVYLATGFTDMRKSINGLSLIVKLSSAMSLTGISGLACFTGGIVELNCFL
jgi:hypothetical protein